MIGLFFVAALGLAQADVDAAYNYCYARYQVCTESSCSSSAEITRYVECRLLCKQVFQGCKDDIIKLIQEQEKVEP